MYVLANKYVGISLSIQPIKRNELRQIFVFIHISAIFAATQRIKALYYAQNI